jgi:hypothetical protein
MKKRPYIAFAVFAVVAALGYWAVAADTATSKEGMMGKEMMKEHMMGGGMCPGHMMMGKMMTECQMVATSDGGVIVKMGTMLMKYDKDLKMVKEVEMKVDTDAMMKKMMDMCAKCPMCMKMKEGEMKEMEGKKMMMEEKKAGSAN